MSYQIKSTPYFRRMLSTSKKNGQLQKLKEEYERIKDFNDQTIEMKMREVRLKRLFKDIEDIKELTFQLPKRKINRIKTTFDLRVETLMKAKELGKEFSKLNGLLGASCSSRNLIPAYHDHDSPQDSQKKRKQLIEKAKSYGNDISRANLAKISTQPHKATTTRKRESLIGKHEMMLHRLQYGNARSDMNMLKVQRRTAKQNMPSIMVKTDNITEQSSMKFSSPRPSAKLLPATPPNQSNLAMNSLGNLQASASFVKERASVTNSFASSAASGNSHEARLRAKKYWRKVALTVLNRFDKAIRCATKDEDVYFSDDNTDNESCYNNVSDLASSITLTEKSNRGFVCIQSEVPEMMEEDEENEVLKSIENLNPALSPAKTFTTSMYAPQVEMAENTNAPTTEELSDVNLLDAVKDYTKKEPFAREAAEKEVFEGVQKLRSIFESQCE